MTFTPTVSHLGKMVTENHFGLQVNAANTIFILMVSLSVTLVDLTRSCLPRLTERVESPRIPKSHPGHNSWIAEISRGAIQGALEGDLRSRLFLSSFSQTDYGHPYSADVLEV